MGCFSMPKRIPGKQYTAAFKRQAAEAEKTKRRAINAPPGIMKIPFRQITAANSGTRLLRISAQHISVPERIAEPSALIRPDMGEAISLL